MALSSSSMPRTAELYTMQKQIEELETRGRSLSPEDNEARAEQLKTLQKAQKKAQTRISLSSLLGSLLVVTVFLALFRALPEGLAKAGPANPVKALWESFFWLLQAPAVVQGATGDFLTVLTPFLAISVAIERLLETGFNWFEQSSRAIADILVTPKHALDWVGQEYQEAYEATQKAMDTVGVKTTPEKLTVLNQAEERLSKAEERLRGWVNAPEYLAWKKALAIWFGLLIGLVLSVIGDLGMLRFIGIATPRFVDMLVTGLIIGSGPGPMHDLLGILQGGKSAISSLGDLAKGKSVKEAADALRKETEALVKRRDAA